METPVEGVEETVAAASQATSGLAAFLSAHGVRLLIVVAVTALIVYSVIYLRKRFAIVREFFQFLKERQLWWMTPIAVTFVLLALLVVVTENSAILAFLYPLF